jgi:hypothetical protein
LKQVTKEKFDNFITDKIVKEIDYANNEVYIYYVDETSVCIELYPVDDVYGKITTKAFYYIDE